jgi:hypothetical protein
VALPQSLAWLFPEHDVRSLQPKRDARLVISRILEQGRLDDVRWCVRTYGFDGIHASFRSTAHPEISARTRRLWQLVLKAQGEVWPESRRSRLRSAAPFVD